MVGGELCGVGLTLAKKNCLRLPSSCAPHPRKPLTSRPEPSALQRHFQPTDCSHFRRVHTPRFGPTHQQMLKWRKFMRDQNHNPNPTAAPRAPKLDPNSTPLVTILNGASAIRNRRSSNKTKERPISNRSILGNISTLSLSRPVITRASTRRSFPSASIPPAIPPISNRHFTQLEIGPNFMKTKRK
jgi:hypothetical protein